MNGLIYTDPDKKQWHVVDVRKFKTGDFIIDSDGVVLQVVCDDLTAVRAIVEPAPPPRRVPTDQDAAVWPRRKCWVRDDLKSKWFQKAALLYVQSDVSFPFITDNGCWRYCEIEDDTQSQNGV